MASAYSSLQKRKSVAYSMELSITFLMLENHIIEGDAITKHVSLLF